MRRIVFAALAASALFAAGAVATQAAAMPAAAPLADTAETGLLQDAAYVCRPIWRCGRYGCGWRRVCYWTPGVRYFGPRWGGRHRHWHRW